MKTEAFQPNLIDPDPPICETRLIAGDSPRIAYYRIAVFYLPGGGYRVEKSSGAANSKGVQENFWRPSFKSAMEKKNKLVAAKLRKKRGPRIYVEVGSC